MTELRRVRDRNREELARLQALLRVRVGAAEVAALARQTGASVAPGPQPVERLLRTPGIRARHVSGVLPQMRRAHPEVLRKLEVQVRYSGYVRRQERQVEAARRLEERRLPHDIRYREIFGLSAEAAQKLERLRPRTLGQASRIDGVRAADVSLLLVHLERHRRKQTRASA